MPKEIERKFLVPDGSFTPPDDGVEIRQGYLMSHEKKVVRVRLFGAKAYLCVKAQLGGITRLEYEYSIPTADAHEMLDRLCSGPLIEKTRYNVRYADLVWDIDVFHGANHGLTLAEVELENEEQSVEIPPWVGEEVSTDSRYFNANLARNPFGSW